MFDYRILFVLILGGFLALSASTAVSPDRNGPQTLSAPAASGVAPIEVEPETRS
jgi:hypothetical protein